MKEKVIIIDSPLLRRIQEQVPEFDTTPYLKVTDMKSITVSGYRDLVTFFEENQGLTAEQYSDVLNGMFPGSSGLMYFVDASKGGSGGRCGEPDPERARNRIIEWLNRHGEKLENEPGYTPTPLLIM